MMGPLASKGLFFQSWANGVRPSLVLLPILSCNYYRTHPEMPTFSFKTRLAPLRISKSKGQTP